MKGLIRRLRRLGKDQRGAVAVTLALSLIPLSVAGLGAVDLTRAVSARSQLQDALDAATLAAARQAATKGYYTDLQTDGTASWNGNLASSPDFTVTGKTFALAADGTTVIGDASATVNSVFVHYLIGASALNVTAHSEVAAGSKNVEVSLVVDVTGSMKVNYPRYGMNKIGDLQTAADQLIAAVVKPQQTPFYSRMAIIPFSAGVNVGSGNAASYQAPLKKTCNTDKAGCSTITFTPAASGGARQPFPLSSSCVTERIENIPTDTAAKSGKWLGYLYTPTDGSNNCPTTSVQFLTDNVTTLDSTISQLQANYSTAGQVGLAWGWYMISPNFVTSAKSGTYVPSSYADVTSRKTLKAVVLMTDGSFNTAYCKGVVSYNSSSSQDAGIDGNKIANCTGNGDSVTQSKLLCDQMKMDGIVIYTVGFDLQDDPNPQSAISLLSYCATNSSNFFNAATGTDLKTAFAEIGQDINNLRLSK